jgi:uncharacterized membrane protein
MKSFLFVSQAGCLIPFLMVFNLFFGWLFLKPLMWLAVEGILIIMFLINSYIFSRKLSSYSKKQEDYIDVEGEVVKERKKIK